MRLRRHSLVALVVGSSLLASCGGDGLGAEPDASPMTVAATTTSTANVEVGSIEVPPQDGSPDTPTSDPVETGGGSAVADDAPAAAQLATDSEPSPVASTSVQTADLESSDDSVSAVTTPQLAMTADDVAALEAELDAIDALLADLDGSFADD